MPPRRPSSILQAFGKYFPNFPSPPPSGSRDRQGATLDVVDVWAGFPGENGIRHTRAYSQSNPISSETAECVIAPALIRSTPVRAIAATVSSRTPPEASNSTAGEDAFRIATAAANCVGDILSSRTIFGLSA